jgi:hypothetical protein
MCRAREANDDRNMAIFLIEVHIPDAGASELELAVGLLVAARLRMRGPASVAQAILTGFSRVDGRLICLIELTSLESAERLVSLALLPPGRIREIIPIADVALLDGRDPGGDGNPRVEAELVEDVVNMGLDGPLREE